jgi:fatty acid-binding protein DegV
MLFLINKKKIGSKKKKITDTDPGGHLTTDQAGSETYLEIFESIEKKYVSDIINIEFFSEISSNL